MPRPKKIKEEIKVNKDGSMEGSLESLKKVHTVPPPEPETISIPKAEWEKVLADMKMLRDVADKGRVYNYESNQKSDKKPKRVKLAKYNGGYIIAWETQKDELIKHPVTGQTVGENQQIEVKILMPNGDIVAHSFNSYVSFSNARYDSRDECEVVGTSENYGGQIKWTLALPDGRNLEIDPRYVN